ncbi:helix-turn-helix domain-containing protein [Nisaea sp.]
MQLESTTARLIAPALTAVTPNAIHGYVFRPDTEGYVLTVAEAYLTELVGHADDAAARDAIRTSAIVPLANDQEMVEEIRLACERVLFESRREQAGKHALVAADLLRILGLFIRLTESAREAKNDPTVPDNLFERFRTLVEECFREQLTITDYAERLATSERTLRRATQARSGRTPLEILKQRTLLEAQRDLLYTARSVAEVAYGLGFEDQAYFSRFFASGTGLTPTQFRKQHKSYLTATPEPDTAAL